MMILEIPENCYRCKSIIKIDNQIYCKCEKPKIILSKVTSTSTKINKILYCFDKYVYIFYLASEVFYRDDGKYEEQDGWHQPNINNHEKTLEFINKLEMLRIFR